MECTGMLILGQKPVLMSSGTEVALSGCPWVIQTPFGSHLIMPVCEGVGRALDLKKEGWGTGLDFRTSSYVTSPSLSFLIYEMDMLMPAQLPKMFVKSK